MKILKLFGLIFFSGAILFFGIAGYLYSCPANFDRLNFVQRWLISGVNKKWDKYIENLPVEKQNIPDLNDLLSVLNPVERSLIEKILAIEPKNLGFMGPYFGIEGAGELVTIPNKNYNFRGVEIESGVNFVSPKIHEDYLKMNEAMAAEIGKILEIENAYRTPGLSARLFFDYLEKENNWSLRENAKWVAMPGYSEHNRYEGTAIDFINQEGISGGDENQVPEDFEKLPEYEWMLKNAQKYNFYLSYPRDNQYGVGFEPWHWHWEKK
ncbi:MAG: M15 family metallopeptidase [Patescibacteria group bacterium]